MDPLNRRDLLRTVAAVGIAAGAGRALEAQTVSDTTRFFPGFKPFKVKTSGAEINGVIGGSGPPLLLLHGAPQSHVSWRLVAPRLAATRTVVVPDLRGMFSWDTQTYVGALRTTLKRAKADMNDQQIDREMRRFFGKIQFSIRNRGLSPEERAINAAATNAFNVSEVIAEAGQEGLSLRDVGVERSPLNRPGSEYFDVLLTFFDPRAKGERAPLLARFTIDVSDTVPVVIGQPVTWYEY